MSEASQDTATRSIIVEREVEAPPAIVWETLTSSEELRRWFPMDARVDPRVGGTVWLSWGPGSEGEAPIHVWDPPHRFGWTESYGDDAEGRPVEVAVDFYVEARDGTTVVRLVQSGFSAAAEWDSMYDALKDGWTYFMFNLAFYLAKHRGKPRTMAWRRVATELGREAVWERLLGGALIGATAGAAPGNPFELHLAQPQQGEIVSARAGHHFTGTLPGMDDSLLFVELEGKHVGVWLSMYGADQALAEEVQESLTRGVEAALGTA